MTEAFKMLTTTLGPAKMFEGYLTESFMSTYEYKGFEVVAFRLHFQDLCEKLTDKHTIHNGKEKIPAHGKENINQVIAFLIALFNLRGNNITAITDALTGDPKKCTVGLLNVLQVKRKVIMKDNPRSALTVTLARIASAFPIQAVVMVADDSFDRQIIDATEIGNEQKDKFGRIAVHPQLPSILSEPMKKKGWVFMTFWNSVKLNKVIGGSTAAINCQAVWNYQKASLCSKALFTHLDCPEEG